MCLFNFSSVIWPDIEEHQNVVLQVEKLRHNVICKLSTWLEWAHYPLVFNKGCALWSINSLALDTAEVILFVSICPQFNHLYNYARARLIPALFVYNYEWTMNGNFFFFKCETKKSKHSFKRHGSYYTKYDHKSTEMNLVCNTNTPSPPTQYILHVQDK